MSQRFFELMLTPEVKEAQARYFGRSHARPGPSKPDRLGEDEAAFIAGLDSFYLG